MVPRDGRTSTTTHRTNRASARTSATFGPRARTRSTTRSRRGRSIAARARPRPPPGPGLARRSSTTVPIRIRRTTTVILPIPSSAPRSQRSVSADRAKARSSPGTRTRSIARNAQGAGIWRGRRITWPTIQDRRTSISSSSTPPSVRPVMLGSRAHATSRSSHPARSSRESLRRDTSASLTVWCRTTRASRRKACRSSAVPTGWLTDLQIVSEDRVVGLKGTRDVLQLTREEEGYSFLLSSIPRTVAATSLRSFWSPAGDTVWLSGAGLVVQGTNVWDAAGAYRISTIALGGSPLNHVINRVRGTSNSNLWAVGDGYALHKTTP